MAIGGLSLLFYEPSRPQPPKELVLPLSRTPESVRLMTTVQTGALKTGFTEGNGWGLGWCVVREPQGVTAALSPGTFGHGGAYGTQAWIDPAKKRVYVLMVQRANFPNSDASDVRRAFQEAADAALGGAK